MIENKSNNFSKEIDTHITIIGGGPGGYVAAIQAAKMGAKVVLVEKDRLGGTCLNRGCVPTKALVRSANVYNIIKNSKEFGVEVESCNINIEKIIERKDNIVNQLVKGISFLIKKNKIIYIEGQGEIKDKNTVIVKEDDILINTKNIIIATGSTADIPPIKGIDNENVLTSTQMLDLKELPESLVIIGGGVIGMEFAFIYASFGVKVTVIEFLSQILNTFDKDVLREIKKSAKKAGISIHTNAKVIEIKESKDKNCVVAFEKNEEVNYVTSNKVLISAGRKPYFKGIGLEKLGIELNDGDRGIKVNEKMQTSIPNIYAIGDVTNKILLAHVASHQGVVAVKNILNEDTDMDYSAIPSAVFTVPEIGTVGINEKTAEEMGIDYKVGKFPFTANGKALTAGKTEGFVKIIRDVKTNRVIGATIIGTHATDLIAEITLAIKNNLTIYEIIETIYAHPTTAEAIYEAALDTLGEAIHL
jgi:dihydrolipoamide dehydrogenase